MNNAKLIQSLQQYIASGEPKSSIDIVSFIKSAEKADENVQRVIRPLRGLALTQDEANEIIAAVQDRVR